MSKLIDIFSLELRSRTEKLLLCASLSVLLIFMVIPDRHLFFLRGLPRIHFACPLIVVVCVLMILLRRILAVDKTSLKEALKKYAPLLVFCGFNICFALLTMLRKSADDAQVNVLLSRWWVNYLFAQLALLSAWYLGRKTVYADNRLLGKVLIIALSVMLVLSVGEYLHLSGFTNLIGSWLRKLNHDSEKLYSIWIWRPPEAVRAEGLGRYPSRYAFSALVSLCWALSSTTMRKIRIAVMLLSVSVCLLTGTRTAFVALLILVGYYLVSKIREQGFSTWFARWKKHIIIAAASAFVFLIGAALIFGSGSAVLRASWAAEFFRADSSIGSQDGSGPTLSEISSGRTIIWKEALSEIRKHPLGIWRTSNTVVQAYAHNEVLDRWLTAGPLSVALYAWFIWWLFRKADTMEAPHYARLFALLLLSFGLFEVVFAQAAFAQGGFYVLGFMSVRKGRTFNTWI